MPHVHSRFFNGFLLMGVTFLHFVDFRSLKMEIRFRLALYSTERLGSSILTYF